MASWKAAPLAEFLSRQFLSAWSLLSRNWTSPRLFSSKLQLCHAVSSRRNNGKPSQRILLAFWPVFLRGVLSREGCSRWAVSILQTGFWEPLHSVLIFNDLLYGMPDQLMALSFSNSTCGLMIYACKLLTLRSIFDLLISRRVAFVLIASKCWSITSCLLATWDSWIWLFEVIDCDANDDYTWLTGYPNDLRC